MIIQVTINRTGRLPEHHTVEVESSIPVIDALEIAELEVMAQQSEVWQSTKLSVVAL